MPLPFLLVGAALLAGGGGGAAAGVTGVLKLRKANKLHDELVEHYETERDVFLENQESVEATLAQYGELKIDVMADTVRGFVEAFSKLNNVHFDEAVADDVMPLTQVELEELRRVDLQPWIAARKSLKGGVAGYAAGSAGAGLAQLAVGNLAVAGTGAAISGLSGAAATNATLAWLGGGALSSGGAGVAGGAMILNGIAIAPVLLVGGLVMWNRGDKALDDAQANAAEVEEGVAKMRAARVRFTGLRDITVRAHEVLEGLDDRLSALVPRLERVVARENDYMRLSQDEQELVATAAALSVGVRTLVDVVLIGDNGAPSRRARQAIDAVKLQRVA